MSHSDKTSRERYDGRVAQALAVAVQHERGGWATGKATAAHVGALSTPLVAAALRRLAGRGIVETWRPEGMAPPGVVLYRPSPASSREQKP